MSLSRFHDGLRGVTHTVRVFVFGRELRIVGANDVTLAVWKLDAVRAAPDADPDGAVTLTARDTPGMLLIDDAAELDSLRRAGVWLPGRARWSSRHWIGACAGLVVAVGLLIAGLNALPRLAAAAIPIAWEQRLGDPAEALFVGSMPRCAGARGQAALEALVQRLREAGGIAMPVTIAVLDNPVINAFTLPGGHVLVMRGMVDMAEDGPMLAGVIAHEMGHVAHRDSTTLMLRSIGVSWLLRMIGIGDTAGGLAAGAGNLMNLAYTRAAEAAADATALDLLTKAGLRADGLNRFFTSMEQRSGETGDDQTGSALSWFATHPSGESRRQRTLRPATGAMPFTDAEWHAIKTMCGAR